MKKNLDTTGRVFRFIIAIILLVVGWVAGSWIALALGLFTLYEALASWCVVYQLLGINHCPIEKK